MIIKCKMCGGDLSIQEGNPVCECEFCGTQQTVPQIDDEKKANLFNRANRLRINAEFDKAATVYASITAEFPEEAEAYWGLCLCKYGIEYVDDPKTGNKIPTCHRTRPKSIIDDNDFDQACEYADPIAKRLYREEAKEIDRIQQNILSIVSKEQPYDVFICYKETDSEGNRTEDSVLAQDIYDTLTDKGLKVFFARITLEDKLGQEYEPYIYAALHSSKVMLAIGTSYEHFDAVWVKNEWARFLDMMKNEKNKVLIPCYKGLDAYDMPKEFKNLQAQDMGKLGWLQDLTRGTLKLCGKLEDQNKPAITQSIQATNPTIESLLRRAQLFLEDQKWDNAVEYADKILDIDAENAEAYLVKLMADLNVRKETDLGEQEQVFDGNEEYEKIMRFGDDTLKKRISGYSACVKNRNERAQKQADLIRLSKQIKRARSEEKCELIRSELVTLDGINGVEQAIKECDNKENEIRSSSERKEKAEETIKKMKSDFSAAESEYLREKQRKEALEKEVASTNEKVKTLNHKLIIYKQELSNLKGLFTGKRRSELETNISRYEKDLQNAKDAAVRAETTLQQEDFSGLSCPDRKKFSFDIAMTYYNLGLYVDSYKALETIKNMPEANRMLQCDEHLLSVVHDMKIEAYMTKGSTVKFGRYPQSRTSTIPEPIEWIVLDVREEEGQCLLLSKYAIEAKQYHNENDPGLTWEKSTLRKWLNSDFLKTTFSVIEQSALVTTTVKNGIDQCNQADIDYFTSHCNKTVSDYEENDTLDQVFLLSYYEANNLYFTNGKSRICYPTDIAKAHGAGVSIRDDESRGACHWWLRTPGKREGCRGLVDIFGTIYDMIGFYSQELINQFSGTNMFNCVRPAMWISVDSDYFDSL